MRCHCEPEAILTETITHKGRTYRVQLVPDYDCGPPWERDSGCGGVRHVRSARDKAPGERLMHGRSDLLAFDFAGTVRKLRAVGCTGAHAAECAESMFKHCAGYLREDWSYVGVIVSDHDGQESLWGVECGRGCGEYWREVAQDLAGELHHAYTKRNAELDAVMGGL